MGGLPRRRLLASLPGVLGLCAARPLAAADRPLRAAVLQIEPYGMRDAQGRDSGLFVEVFALLARQSGRRIDTIVAPYARAVALLSSGQADLLLAIGNEAIAKAGAAIALVWEVEIIAIGRAGLHLTAQRDLHGLTVAQIRGTDYDARFMQDAAIRHYETADQLTGMRMLMEGRVDAVIGTRVAVFHAMRALGVERGQLGASVPMQRRAVHLHLTHRQAATPLRAELEQAVAALRARGALEGLGAKYFGDLPRA